MRNPSVITLLVLLAIGLVAAPPHPGLAQDDQPGQTAPASGEQPQVEEGGKKSKKGEKQQKKVSRRKALKEIESLSPQYRDWVNLVEFLISTDELRAFLELEKDYQRDAFIERFWRVRDKYTDSARNEFKERWIARAQAAVGLFGNTTSDRARMYMINGPPTANLEIDCTALWPLDIWYFARGEGKLGYEMFMVFYQQMNHGEFRLWQPADGLGRLAKFAGYTASEQRVIAAIRDECLEEDDLIGILMNMMRRGANDYALLIASIETPPEVPMGGEWIDTFNSYSTDLPDGVGLFDANVDFDFPGRHQSRTIVQTSVLVPVANAQLAELGGANTYNFALTGEVLRDGKLFDNFQYKFNLPAADIPSDQIPLVFERRLRAGEYQFIVKLEDLNSSSVFRHEQILAVPAVDHRKPPPEPDDPETARLLAEANAAISTGDNTIQIVRPQGRLHTGMIRFDTLTTGADISKVTFAFDDREIMRKRRPPYSVELDLGPLPRMRNLTAIAFDANDEELDRDTLVLNAGANRFEVRLAEPRPGKRYVNSLRAVAKVNVPDDQVVERVEFYLNEQLVAELFQEPFEQPILLPDGDQVAYVRAVAYQPDGNSTEDLVFVNAPEYLEEVDVQFVELYITASDKNQRPVGDLVLDEFRVLEDGIQQSPARFDLVKNLPIHAGILVDVSASMVDRLDTAQQAALQFFENSITDRDRATLITFNDHPNLAVKFTNNLQTLAGGLAGLQAERGTALYDSVIFSLYYFNGIKGQRALVLVSDGEDESSRFSLDDALDYSRRTGVAIYAIGLNLQERLARKALKQLSEETGGRSFFLKSVEELPGIYRQIQEELRSRYYLAYQSSNTGSERDFRTIEVEILRPGIEAKTLRGYYP